MEKGYKDVSDDDVPDEAWDDIFKEIQSRIGENLDEDRSGNL